MGIRCSSPSIYLYIETMIGYLYPSKKATPERVPSYTDHLVSLLSHLTKHLPALTKVQQRNVVTLLTLLLSLLGLTLSFFLYTHVCSCASSHLKLKSIETEEFQVETLEEPASVSSKNYLKVILSTHTNKKDVPEEGGKAIKEMEEIEDIKQVKDIDNTSGIEIDETNHDVSISAKEVIAAKATFKEKLLNFFRVATRSNTEQDPVIDEIIEEVAAELEEETVDTILETTKITEEAVEEITDEDEKVVLDTEIEVPEREFDEEITLIVEEKTEDDQIQNNNVDVFDESCDNLPEEPSLRDTLWGLLGCGVANEEVENSVVEDNEEIQMEEASEEISIEEAIEEISIEEAIEEISIEEATEIEIQTES